MKQERDCPVCGATYYAELRRLKLGRQTTCSRVCSYRLRTDNLTKRVAIICATCGKNFERSSAQIKGKHDSQFCSPACHYAGRSLGLSQRVILTPYKITEEGRNAWRAGAKKTREIRILRDNYKHTEATKAKLSVASAKAISEGRIKTSSRLEHEVRLYLEATGVVFVAQCAVRNRNGTFACCFDFYLPDRQLALEVNGTFWHSDPRFFPHGPVHEIQKRNAILWKRKLSTAATLGIEVREAWEHDLRNDLAYTITRIIA